MIRLLGVGEAENFLKLFAPSLEEVKFKQMAAINRPSKGRDCEKLCAEICQPTRDCWAWKNASLNVKKQQRVVKRARDRLLKKPQRRATKMLGLTPVVHIL